MGGLSAPAAASIGKRRRARFCCIVQQAVPGAAAVFSLWLREWYLFYCGLLLVARAFGVKSMPWQTAISLP